MNSADRLRVARITTELTYELRGLILRPGFPAIASHFPEDARSVHFGAFAKDRLAEDRLIGTVSAHPEQSPRFEVAGQWRIRGMATAEDWQGRGAGSLVLKELLNWGRAEGLALFWCNARERAIPFYERHGFEVVSELFDIPTVGPHKVMQRKP